LSYLFSQTLYKKDQIWICKVIDCGTYSAIDVTFGKIGGKMQTKRTVIDGGKNIGKSNETTHQQQAVSEAQSKVNKQKDKLYVDDKNMMRSRIIPRPMLAHTYDKHSHKIKFPCYVQPKLDGVRCLALDPDLSVGPPNRPYSPVFLSRQGKTFASLKHLTEEAGNLLQEISILVNSPVKASVCLDGELYSDSLEFQKIISAVKRDEPNELTHYIQYHVYDLAASRLTYKERMDVLTQAFTKVQPKLIVNVPTYEIDSPESVTGFHEYYVKHGKEGIMLRNTDGLYTKDKRSYDLQKVKQFDDAEFEITDYSIDKNGHAVFQCVTENGALFEVKPRGDNSTREDYTDNADNLIGQFMTVKYFGMTTGDNPVPRFPVGISIRSYE